VFASVTIVAYGILPRAEIAKLRQPSMAGVLEAAVGGWGAVFVSIGLIVSVLGAYLAWTMMATEVLYVAALDDDMPRFLGRVNRADAPAASVVMSTVLIQLMLLVTMASSNAFDFALNMTSALTLFPFLLAAGYALKIGITRDGEGAPAARWSREVVIAGLATAYTAFLLYAAGPKYMLLSMVIYAPGTVFFAMARREQGRTVFSARERVIFAVSVVGAVIGVIALVAGWITV